MEETNDNGQASSLAVTLAGLGVAVAVEALTVLATHDKTVRAVSPWQDDPYDVALSHSQFAVPMLAAVIAVRLLAWRAPGGQDRARQVVRATGMMTALIGLTLAFEWAAVAVGATPGLGAVDVGTDRRAGRDQPASRRRGGTARAGAPPAGRGRTVASTTGLDDIITVCGRVPGTAPGRPAGRGLAPGPRCSRVRRLERAGRGGDRGRARGQRGMVEPAAGRVGADRRDDRLLRVLPDRQRGRGVRRPAAPRPAPPGGRGVGGRRRRGPGRGRVPRGAGDRHRTGPAKSVPAVVALTLGAGLATSLATAGRLALRRLPSPSKHQPLRKARQWNNPPPRNRQGRRSAPASCPSGTDGGKPSAGSPSRWNPARSAHCSARTGQARRPRCGCWSACHGRQRLARLLGEPSRLAAGVLARVGVAIDGPAFVPHLSGRRNLELAWRAGGRAWPPPALEESLQLAGGGQGTRREEGQELLDGHAPAAHARPGSHGRPRGAHPGRAGQQPRPRRGPHAPRAPEAARGARHAILISSHVLAEIELLATHVVVMNAWRGGHGGTAGGPPRHRGL